jgi:hypothetical protein
MTLHEITPYLEDLEERIDGATETALLLDWITFTEGRWQEELFEPRRPVRSLPRVDWPAIALNDTFNDPVLMLLHQLSVSSKILAAGTGELLCMRANYGTPTVPSLYGAKLFVMPAEANTLPACYPLPDGLDGVLRRLEKGEPDLNAGLAPSVLATGELFRDVVRRYPRIARHIAIYHPDLQGPMDVCELLVGSALFTELVDRPEDIHAVLRSITRTYRAFMSRWHETIPPVEQWSVHWNMLHRGRIMLRDDSATNLSPAMFDEFIKPYDQELLRVFGGGAMHFCGRGDRFIQAATAIPLLYAVHMSQPELNDVEKVCLHTIDKGINLIGVKREAGRKLVEQGRPLKGRVHCWDGIPK